MGELVVSGCDPALETDPRDLWRSAVGSLHVAHRMRTTRPSLIFPFPDLGRILSLGRAVSGHRRWP